MSNITLGGFPISPGTSYRVTVNSFLADGGDNYGILTQGTDRVPGNVDTDAFENYLVANPAGITPGAEPHHAAFRRSSAGGGGFAAPPALRSVASRGWSPRAFATVSAPPCR